MDTDQLEEFANAYTDAWNSREPARVSAFFEQEGTLFVNGEPAAGRAAITGVAESFMTAFPDLKLVMDRLEVLEDGARYHWTFSGANTGPGGTGNAVRFSGYEEWRFGSAGLIDVSEGHFDAEDYERQLNR